MHKKTSLPSGLRLITKKLEGTKAVTVLVLVGAGSRYETKDINGISHFLEHMFFKGAKKYENTKAVSSAIDSIGGDFNAFTAKEYAGYYVKVSSDHLDTAMDVLSDMLLNAKFDQAEIDKERGVILEEYNMYQDTPMYQIGWDFENLIFGDQPLGWDQIGTKELIQTVTQQQFFDYKNALYTPDNTVICIAGNIDHDEAVAKAELYFPMQSNKQSLQFLAFDHTKATKNIRVKNKKTEQAHLVIGFPSVAYKSEMEWESKILATLLGGNMSSRMFLNVREAQGLCYYVRTETDEFSDIGTFSTRAGVDVNRIQDAIQAITNEYGNIFKNKPDEEEIARAKSYLKGKIVLRLEDSEEYAHMLARQELLESNIETPEEIISKIDSIDQKRLLKFAEQYLVSKNLYMSVIGPYANEDELSNLLNF